MDNAKVIVTNEDVLYSALKLIECLYNKGELSESIYSSIHKKYADVLMDKRCDRYGSDIG